MGFIVGLILGIILMSCLVAGGNFEYKTKWYELEKWLLCMIEVSHLDSNCLREVLSKMKKMDGDDEDE